MRLKVKALFLVFLFCVMGAKAQDAGLRSSIIPAPAKVEKLEGEFVFNDQTGITADDMQAEPIARFFKAYVSDRSKPGSVQSKRNRIRFTSKGADGLPDEGYKLNITPEGIMITGKKAGLFYGMQSLIQLFPVQASDNVKLPCMNITDYPRFAYRGLMLDVSRHFFTVAQVKDLLDIMAHYKLNRFHWHLTDDQGWRIEIKSLPKLTQIGAFRVPRNGDFGAMEAPRPGEKATDGGFYTQEEIKDVVRYAAERNIQVMPEIDVPGHSMAAIAAYPHLSCTQDTSIKVNPGSSFAKWFPDGKYEMYTDNTLNPASEATYVFLDKVFTEVAALFPYEYIHIGGDECFKGFWEKDAGVQAFMKKMNIGSTHELQGYFITRLNKIILSKKKKLIGWDEILEGGLNEQVAIMNRFGEKGAVAQLKKGLNIVLAPGNNGLYFDYAQSRSDMEPINHGGFSPVWKAYGYNPEYGGLNDDDKKHIMGVSGCVWTEHIPSVSKLQYMVFPRMFALAETAWSQEYNKDYKVFAETALPKHLGKLDKSGYNYRVPTPFAYTDTTMTGKHFYFDLKVPMAGAKIYYTLNNRLPGDADHEYREPVSFDVPEGKKRVLKIIVISPSGRRSVVTSITLDNSI
ncbi:beta-N-acetylhexosaminidase [Pedobacter africanus]|uniref:beta-N-acetylhexosaminidase n=1 Tax=Pedobacter africanus TaxID=151894 RepID=A0A1W1YWF0_9SPHI|nr:family 20 glycosylhydrolase [Pedobacter africanus]SMC40456.1 hexosaminidase [Pedobacter africanus]